MPLFTVADARQLWQSIKNDRDRSQWVPDFLHCGPFDYKLQAFPVVALAKGTHQLWIPVEWKFALRFLNHVMYCFWHASLDPRLSDAIRDTCLRMGKYTERLRLGFFDEVLEYWYKPGTQLPTNEQPTRGNQPLHSCYLTSFLVNMFNMNAIMPRARSGFGSVGWKSDPTTFGTCTTPLGTLDGYALLNVIQQTGRHGPRKVPQIRSCTVSYQMLAQKRTSFCQRKTEQHASPMHHLWKLIHLAGLGLPRKYLQHLRTCHHVMLSFPLYPLGVPTRPLK